MSWLGLLCISLMIIFMMMDFNSIFILSWNLRGAANQRGKSHMRDLVKRYHPS